MPDMALTICGAGVPDEDAVAGAVAARASEVATPLIAEAVGVV
jgi:hypothetical protein